MQNRWFYLPTLAIATVGFLLVPLVILFPTPVHILILPWTFICAGITSILFVFALANQNCRNGINAASRELRLDKAKDGLKGGLFNKKWGVIGSRLGSRGLSIIRSMLFVEFLLLLIFEDDRDHALLLLGAAAFSTSMILTFVQIGFDTQFQRNLDS